MCRGALIAEFVSGLLRVADPRSGGAVGIRLENGNIRTAGGGGGVRFGAISTLKRNNAES